LGQWMGAAGIRPAPRPLNSRIPCSLAWHLHTCFAKRSVKKRTGPSRPS